MPILRAGRSLGVLVVQNKAHRKYREDEVEALETTSMVVAEMIATGELKQRRPGLPSSCVADPSSGMRAMRR